MEEEAVDVVVVGAGLAGLAAAHHLKKKEPGLSIVVLEAKGRVGGRTEAVELQGASGTDTWDVGGQWIGTCQPHVISLMEELGLEKYLQHIAGRKVMQLGDNKVRTYESDIPALPWYALIDLHFFMNKVEKMGRLVPISDPSQCKHAQEWDSMTFEQFKCKELRTKGAREAIDAAGRCMFGTEASHISLLYYLSYVNAAGSLDQLILAKENCGQEFKIKGGAAQLAVKLAELLGSEVVRLEQPAHSILQDGSGVHVVTSKNMRLKGQRVILAVPPHLAAKIEYTPMLPVNKLHVLQRMPVGYLTKIIVTYSKAFWREEGYSGEVVTNGGPSILPECSTGPLCIIYDAMSASGNPAIVTFIGGKQQLEYTRVSATDRRRAVLESLASYFGPAALEPLDYAEKNWNEEPYNGGCPVSVGTCGMMTEIGPGLREPFKRIHFAGTESATVWCGFLNGAIQSGQRAACEVLYNLRPHSLTGVDLVDTVYAAPVTRGRPLQYRGRHKVVRWTVGLGMLCILIVAFKKRYFRILL